MTLNLATIEKHLPTVVFEKLQQLKDELSENEARIDTFSGLPLMLRKQGVNQFTKVFHQFNTLDLARLYWVYLHLETIDFPQWLSISDDEEKQSLVLGLSLLDAKGKYVDDIVDLKRTNSVELLAALALNNDYPAQFFNEPDFNQLVLKSLFCNIDISSITRLSERLNPELTRMTTDYREELIAANRAIPVSLPLAIEPHL